MSIVLFLLFQARAEEADKSGDDIAIDIDFNEVIREKYIIYQQNTSITSFNITNVPKSVTLSFIGDRILFLMRKNQDNTAKLVITPSEKDVISIYLAPGASIDIHNKFISNFIYTCRISIHVFENSELNFLSCSWLDSDHFLTIYQYYSTIYRMKSMTFPANLIHIQKSTSTFISETKGLAFYSDIKPQGDLIFECIINDSPIFINNLVINQSNIRIKSSNKRFNISRLNLHDSTLNMDFADITSRRISLSDSSYLACSKLNTRVIVFNYIDNDLVPLRLDELYSQLIIIFLNASESLEYVFCKMKDRTKFDVKNVTIQVVNENFDYKQEFNYNKRNEQFILNLNYRNSLTNKVYVSETGRLEFLDGTRFGFDEFREKIKGIDYAWKKFELVIWDEYKEPLIIDHFSSKRCQFVITSHHKTNQVYFNSNENFRVLQISNLTLINPNDRIINITNCYIYNSIIKNDVKLTGKTINIRNSDTLTDKIYSDKLLFNINGESLDVYNNSISNEHNDTIVYADHNFVEINASFLKFNQLSRFKYFVSNVKSDLNLFSEVPMDNFILRSVGKVILNMKRFPKTFSGTFPELIIKNYTKIHPKTNLTIAAYLSLNYQNHDIIKFNTLNFVKNAAIINSNVLIEADKLTMSTVAKIPTNQTIKCKTLAIYSDTFSDLTNIFGVETIEIHYSLFKCGFLDVKKLTASNYNQTLVQKVTNIDLTFNSTNNISNDEPVMIDVAYKEGKFKRSENGGLHVKFINDNEQDQFFYDGDWNDFSLDFICFEELEVNLDELSYEFISNTWSFNGSSRVFDMKLIKRNGKSCFSLVHREAKLIPTPKPKKKSTISIIIISSAAVFMALTFAVVTLILVRSHRKKINRFIFEKHTELTDSLLQTDTADL